MTELIRRVFLSCCGLHLGRWLVYSWDIIDVEIFLHHLLPTCGGSVLLLVSQDDRFVQRLTPEPVLDQIVLPRLL